MPRPEVVNLTGVSTWGLKLRPRDFAKLGMLYMNGGQWNDLHIVDSAFVRQSVSQQTTGYGYFLNTYEVNKEGVMINIAEAKGGSAQSIFMCGQLHLLIIFTGSDEGQAHYGNDYYKATGDYIFAALH